MKARDVFGIIVRTMGLGAFLYALWNIVFGLDEAEGIPALIVGIVLMRCGRLVVRFCYPENKDDADE
jgi:hypothetical protein